MKSNKRAILLAGALAALLPFGAASVVAATVTITAPNAGAAPGITTGFDQAIDLMVQQRMVSQKLSATDARILREQLQLQFQSLTKAEQQSVLAAAAQDANSASSTNNAMRVLNEAVTTAARQALADVQAAATPANINQQATVRPKLGPGSVDLVFVATAGPCRIYDSRNGPGQLPALSAVQIFGFSNTGGYPWSFDQGGTGSAGSGNCAGTVYPLPVSNYPVAVVVTIGVINPITTGSMRAWNGGTTLTVGGVLGWNAGDVLANTTVIPMDRTISPYPGSGGKRDFGLFNNSGGPIDIVADVVGYYIENEATPVQCTTLTSTPYNLAANAFNSGASPACATGYTRVVTTCFPSDFFVGQVGVSGNTCFMRSTSAAAQTYTATSVCCRIPGR